MCYELKDRLDQERVKAKCALARLVKSQEGSIKCCFRVRRRVPARDIEGVSRRGSRAEPLHPDKPLNRVVDQGFSGHTAGRITQKLSRSHCTTQKAAIREISLNLIFHNCTFSKKVLDTLGNDGFRGKQDVAMVRCPRNRTGLLIGFTAIIATVLVQGPGCNLIGQR